MLHLVIGREPPRRGFVERRRATGWVGAPHQPPSSLNRNRAWQPLGQSGPFGHVDRVMRCGRSLGIQQARWTTGEVTAKGLVHRAGFANKARSLVTRLFDLLVENADPPTEVRGFLGRQAFGPSGRLRLLLSE